MDINLIKQLREETGAGLVDIKKALEEAEHQIEKAKEILKSKGMLKADKKSDREIKAGRVFSYIHANGTVGSLVKIGCETDFVARNDEFAKLGQEIAMQVAAMMPESIEDLLAQNYIRDGKQTISDLIKEVVAKTGENITVVEMARI